MKKNKASYFVGIVFICIIAAFFISICVRVFQTQVLKKYTFDFPTSETVQTIDYSNDWSKHYPFNPQDSYTAADKADEKTEEPTKATEKKTSKYVSKVNDLEYRINYYTTKLLYGRMKMIEAYALFNKTVGMKIVTGTESIVVMNNGYLTFEFSAYDTTPAADSVTWFSNKLAERNVDFAYVQLPAKEDKDDEQLPSGVSDNVNKNADQLLKRLDENKVKYYDFRTLLSQKDDDWYSNFFKTDHHWKPETGVWAAGQLVKLINRDFNYGLDESIGDTDRYKIDVYEKYCLGSQGKIATLTYADPEDISLIYPKADTSYTVQYNNDAPKTGRFEDTLLDKSYVSKIDYYNTSTYSAYLCGNKALTMIKNNNCHNGKRLLLIGDSYSKCVVPYLAEAFENVDMLDRRMFNGSILTYIDETSPDMVIVAYTPTQFSDASTHNSTFNFE